MGPNLGSAKTSGMTGELKVNIIEMEKRTSDLQFIESGDKGNEAAEKEMGQLTYALKQTLASIIMLDEYPKSEIIINLEIFRGNGSLYMWLLNTCTYALLKSGIKMNDICGGSTCVHKHLLSDFLTSASCLLRSSMSKEISKLTPQLKSSMLRRAT